MVIASQFEVECRRDGTIHDEAEVSAVANGLEGLTHLVVMAHGWNNDKADAARLYDAFFQNVEALAEANLVPTLATQRLGVVRLFWPSKKFADADLIPGGGAASAAADNEASLHRALDELKNDPIRLGHPNVDESRAMQLGRAKHQVPNLERSVEARREFVQVIRAVLNPDEKDREDGSEEFFADDPEVLFAHLSAPVPLNVRAGAGGATSVDGGAAGFLGDLLDGVEAGARRIANFATYYQMKARAGIVGRTGVALLLSKVRAARPDLPLVLVGHSFGGRVVTAAASTLSPNSQGTRMLLLQAAFSHNALGEKFDGLNDGAFRTILADKRLSGPVLVTHTKNDRAVGVAYPLASRLARDAAAALGDENDPFGGLGRNGARKTPEASNGVLLKLGGRYELSDGKVFNLLADEFIKDHSDVTGANVAYAFAHLVVP